MDAAASPCSSCWIRRDRDKYPVKVSDLIVFPLDRYRAPIDLVWANSTDLVYQNLPLVGLQVQEYAPYEGCVMFTDPSGRGEDETSYAVVKLLHGRLFLTAIGGYLGGYEEKTLKALLDVSKRHDVKLIACEPNYGGSMFTQLLQSAAQKFYLCGVEDADWSTVAKEQRIVDTLESVLNQHRLVVCPSVIEHDINSVKDRDGDKAPCFRLFFQLSRMVRAKGALAFDDRLDALAGAVAY
jgi:hypothetical protein